MGNPTNPTHKKRKKPVVPVTIPEQNLSGDVSTPYKESEKLRIPEILKTKAGNIAETCRALNIHRSTFYEWVNSDEELKLRVQEVQEGLIDFAESKLMSNINAGKENSIFFYLKCKAKHRGYIEKTEMEIIKPSKVSTMTKEERAKRKLELLNKLREETLIVDNPQVN